MIAYSGHVMTLANSIIGVGILAMPFCFQKCGIILSIALLIFSNWVTRISCHYLIKSSLLTRRKSFEFLGFHAFGSSGKLLVELCIIGYLLGTCITYFVVVGDLGPQIITKMFSIVEPHTHLRTVIMIAVTLVCILPLGMLKNVDSLSAVCTASIGFYICLVIKIVLESEEHIISNDWADKVLYWEPAGILQCLPIFSMALACQMQLFEVFESVNNQSVEKLNAIVRNATWICTFVYIGVGFFGYVAFCTQTFSGNILINFSPSFGSDVIKIGFILSIAFSFPLVIFPCRASIYSLLYRKGHTDASAYIPETRFKLITVFILGFSLCVALMIPSVELIIGLVGSTIGVVITIMFPASCFRKIVKKDSTERNLAQFIIVCGFCLMILGTYANLNAIDEKRSGAHLEATQFEDKLLVPPTEVVKNVASETLKKEKVLLDELKKVEMLQEEEKNLNLINKFEANIKLDEIGNNPPLKQVLATPSTSASPVPPLPVDEKHNEAAAELKPVAEDKVQIKLKEQNFKVISPKAEVPKPPIAASLPAKVPNATKQEEKTKTQQNINKDAIKKEDEVAAEELNKKDTKLNEEELKKTQSELKKTKELLERTVDELKEELAKQNQETQNLVVEKLSEVVEKVEQIERKVQQKNPPAPPTLSSTEEGIKAVEGIQAKPKEAINVSKVIKSDEKVPALLAVNAPVKNKGSLLNILSENAVYEPLSYKTGELMEYVKNGSRLEQRLPLPLALLINASQSKVGENLTRSNQHEHVKSEPLQAPVEENRVEDAKAAEADKENIEAIRRDILQLKTDINAPPTMPAVLRVKRDLQASEFKAIDSTLKQQQNDCLKEPKIETLMVPGVSSAIDFKLQGIGRDLKSVQELDSA